MATTQLSPAALPGRRYSVTAKAAVVAVSAIDTALTKLTAALTLSKSTAALVMTKATPALTVTDA